MKGIPSESLLVKVRLLQGKSSSISHVFKTGAAATAAAQNHRLNPGADRLQEGTGPPKSTAET